MNSTLLALAVSAWQLPANPPSLDSFVIRDRGQVGHGAVSIPRGIELVHKLLQRAGLPPTEFPSHAVNRIIVEERQLEISLYERAGVSFWRRNGQLLGFWISPPRENRAKNLSIGECVEKVNAFYVLAGGTLPLQMARAYFEKDDQYIHVVSKYKAPGTNFLFGAGVEAIVDRTYGTPQNMWIAPRPSFDPPTNVVPKAEALAAAAYVMSRYAGWNVSEVASEEPSFRVPDFRGMPHRMRAIEHSRAQAGRAGLYYEVTVKDGSQADMPEPRRRFAWVMIDAASGEPIAIQPAYQLVGHGSAENPTPLFTWGSKAWRAKKQIGIIQHTDLVTPKSGKRVLLTQGRRHIIAQFDAKSSLVWTTDRSKTIVGKVSSNLARELQNLKTPKVPIISNRTKSKGI